MEGLYLTVCPATQTSLIALFYCITSLIQGPVGPRGMAGPPGDPGAPVCNPFYSSFVL